MLAALSFNVLADVHPLGFIPAFARKNFFDLFNEFAANILLPVGGLLSRDLRGVDRQRIGQRRGTGIVETPSLFRLWRALIRFVAPIAVLAVLVYSTFG